jgi:glycine C-acetyltransferase
MINSTNVAVKNSNDQYKDVSLVDYFNPSEARADLFTKAQMLENWISYLKENREYMLRRTIIGPCSNRSYIKDTNGIIKHMIMMGSNSYFELNNHPAVKEAAREAVEKYGAGAGTAPLFGTLEIHQELEIKIAKFKSCESAIIFSAGFQSNYSIINGLLRENDYVINDMLNHASIVEGCKAAEAKFGAKVDFFPHSNMLGLKKKLKKADAEGARGKLIIVDGVFSMDGDIAPLPDIVKLANSHNAAVMIDDAHGTGVLGENGRGTVEHFGLEGQVDIVAGTLSKGLGVVGGFAAGKKEVIDYLRLYGPGYMFSTAMAPADAGALIKAFEILETDDSLRKQLWRNINYMHKELIRLGFDTNGSETAIIPIVIGDDIKVRKMCTELHDMNIFVNPVQYPAVSKKRSRLRLSLMATHTMEDLDETISALEYLGKKYNVI